MKLGKSILTAGAALALIAQPAAAQDEAEAADSSAEIFEAMAAMFPKEPLSAEEESRLPLASTIVDRMIPPGTLGEMMGGMFDQMLGPVMEMVASNPKGDVADQLGIEAAMLDLSEEQTIEIAGILDPNWQERNQLVAAVMPELMKGMMETMEPAMRTAMTEAYAIYFNEQELADIDAFFSTPSGLNFARKSFTMSSDPRIIAASMESLPAMMATFGEMETKMEEATAALPEPRGWSDLSASDRGRLAELTGMSETELQESMTFAAELKAMMSSEEE